MIVYNSVIESIKGYQLNEGDIIKLGRVKIKILELKRPGKHAPRGPDIEIAKRSGTVGN